MHDNAIQPSIPGLDLHLHPFFTNYQEHEMQTGHLTKGFCMALLLACPMAEADSRYPAADFQSVIIFQDNTLIAEHNQAATKRPSTSTELGKLATEGVHKVENTWLENYPTLLIALALIGFTVWSSKSSKRAESRTPEVQTGFVGGTTAETGVARYLTNLSTQAPAVETGVAKYLQNLSTTKPTAAETGVARYLKNLE